MYQCCREDQMRFLGWFWCQNANPRWHFGECWRVWQVPEANFLCPVFAFCCLHAGVCGCRLLRVYPRASLPQSRGGWTERAVWLEPGGAAESHSSWVGQPRGQFQQPLQEVWGGLECNRHQLHWPPWQPRGQLEHRPPWSLPGRLGLRFPGDFSGDRGKNECPLSLVLPVTDKLRDVEAGWCSLGHLKKMPTYLARDPLSPWTCTGCFASCLPSVLAAKRGLGYSGDLYLQLGSKAYFSK